MVRVAIGKLIGMMLKWVAEKESVEVLVLRKRNLETSGDCRHDGRCSKAKQGWETRVESTTSRGRGCKYEDKVESYHL